MAYVLWRFVRIGEVAALYGRAALWFLALSCCFNTALMWGKIHRLHFLLSREAPGTRFFALSRTYAVANLLGQVSNVLVSDLVSAGALMVGSEHKKRIAGVVLFNRICDLASVLLLAAFFFWWQGAGLKGYLGWNRTPALLLLALFSLGALALLFFRKRFRGSLAELRRLAREWGGAAFGYAVFIYLCYLLSALCDARALKLELPAGYLMMSYLMGSLVSVLPISVAGIGTRDILFVFLMRLVSVAPEAAVALSVLGFLFMPTLSLVVVYLVSLLGVRYEDRRHGRPGKRSGIS